MTQPPKPRISTAPPAPRPRNQGLLSFLSLVFNILLLTVGGSLAWLVGMAIAQVYPNSSSDAPLTEQVLRRLPNTRPAISPAPQPATPSAPSPTPIPPPAQPLTSVQRQQLQAQLQQLQGQLNTLIGRTAALETQLGTSRPSEPLEERLQILEQQLTASATPGTNNGVQPTSPPPQTAPARTQNSDSLVVTFPSDVLFDVGSTILRPGASVILDTIVADLKNYNGSAVRVLGHTDNQGNSQQNLDLSFERAEAVMNYLSDAVGTGYHWVAIGYGSNRPTVENNSAQNRQLNRRIEVAISP